MLTSFGQLKAFNLVKDVTSGLSKVWLKFSIVFISEVLICNYLKRMIHLNHRVMHLLSIWMEVSLTKQLLGLMACR